MQPRCFEAITITITRTRTRTTWQLIDHTRMHTYETAKNERIAYPKWPNPNPNPTYSTSVLADNSHVKPLPPSVNTYHTSYDILLFITWPPKFPNTSDHPTPPRLLGFSVDPEIHTLESRLT